MLVMESLSGDTQNKAWAKDKKKFGYKMLQKMGWTEGKGLGKHEHGMKTHVKIDPKTTREGIGAENDATGNNTLSKGFHEFNSFLTTLSSHYATVQDDNKDSQKKKKKKKDKNNRESKETTASTSLAKETVISNGYKAKRLTYTRFLHTKRVSNYSQRDLSAILGIAHQDNAQPDGTSMENGFEVSAEGKLLREESGDNSPSSASAGQDETRNESVKPKKKKGKEKRKKREVKDTGASFAEEKRPKKKRKSKQP